MGNTQDNVEVTLHRQEGFKAPEVRLRWHRGDQGIDESHELTRDQAGQLVQVAHGGLLPFMEMFLRFVPALANRMPTSVHPVVKAVFRDMRDLHPPRGW